MKLCAKFFFLPTKENLFNVKENKNVLLLLVFVTVFICSILSLTVVYSPFQHVIHSLHFLPLCKQFSFSCIQTHSHTHTETHFKADRLENAINFFFVCECCHCSKALIKNRLYTLFGIIAVTIVCCFCGMRTNATNNKPRIDVFQHCRCRRRSLFLLYCLSIDLKCTCKKVYKTRDTYRTPCLVSFGTRSSL